MGNRKSTAVLVLALLGGAPVTGRTQETAAGLITAARAQLDVPQPDSAARLLERALDARLAPTTAQQTRAWILWGIAQLVRGQMTGTDLRAAAQQAFQRALARNPFERVDSLDVFGDDVVRLFNAERTALSPVAAAPFSLEVAVASDTTVPPDGGQLRLETRPSYPARVFLSIEPEGAPATILWADTQQVRGSAIREWNLRLRDGTLISDGRYVLRGGAADSLQQRSLPVEVTFVVSRAAADTQPLPRLLEPGDFAPETIQLRRGAPAVLLWGASLAALIAAAPSVLGNADINTGGADATAYAVAGGVSLASIVGFLRGSRTRPVPENVERNRLLRERDAQERQAVAHANDAARARAGVRIQVVR